jgi:hypothetical protein
MPAALIQRLKWVPNPVPLVFLTARGDLDLVGVSEVEQQVRRRRIAPGRFGLQAAQDDLLHPLGQVGAQGARGFRIHPQALAHAAGCLRRAEGQLAGGQLIQDHPDGKDVAARITAHTDHLLGRYPRGRSDRLAQFFGQQVGIVRMARQAEVQKYGHAVFSHQHVGWFEIQVAYVLPVQTVRGPGHGGAELGQGGGIRPFGLVQPVLKGVALHVLHDQIRDVVEITGSNEARDVQAGQDLHDPVLDLEAHDVLGTIPSRHAGDLHGQRKTRITRSGRIVHTVDVGHPPCVNAILNDKSVQFGSRFQQFQRPSSRRLAKYSGSPAALMAAAADW